MKKQILLLMCLIGIGMSYAEDVHIGLTTDNNLRINPGHLFLDNTPVLYACDRVNVNWSKDIINPEVTMYDLDLKLSSTIHFNCDLICDVSFFDTRFDSYEFGRLFSQSYFNNDPLYECVTCDIKTEIDEWGYESYSYSNYRVINQNGEVLYTFEAPEGYKCDGYSLSFHKVSDDIIIVGNGYNKIDDEYSYCTCWYSLKVGQTGTLAPIQQMREMKLEANPVAKGDDLVVTVGADCPQSSIMVTSISGKIIKEVPVIEGKAVVSTSDLPCGLYIASQKGGASAKFIVK